MEHRISVREANLRLSRYLEEVAGGDEVVITKRGQPIARLVPARPKRTKLTATQAAALRRMRAALRKGIDLGGNAWPGRDAIYDRTR